MRPPSHTRRRSLTRRRIASLERLETRTMLAANQAPVNHVPGAQSATIDLPHAFTQYRGNQLSISDADAGENAVRVTLSVDKGTITLLNPDPNGGLTYSAGDGTEDASMTFVGTVADINTALQWVSYRPQASYTGLATFTITTNDLGNVGTGGAKTDTDTIAITVNPVPAFAASPTYETLPGVLDTSLNGTGKQVLSLTAGIDYIHDMKVMPDGKILAVGALNDRFGLMRFNADMTLDTSFGTTGMTQTDFGAGVHARSLAIESSGRIVVVGGNRIARYTETGVLDTAFGTNGSVTNANVGQAYGVAIQADGRVVVAGRDNNYFKVARYSAAGVLDADWSYNVGNGYSGDYGRAVVVRDDGDIFVAGKGYFWNGTDYDNFTVDRIDANGTLEQEFSYNLGSDEFVNSMLALPDGKLLLIGRCNGDLTITRHAASGALDTSFGTSGIVRVPILNAADEGYRATLAADGKILVTGFANNGTNQDLFVVRLTSNGVLDNNFGIGGKVAVNLGSNDYGYAIAALPDGKILVAGRSANDIALVRLLGDSDQSTAKVNQAPINNVPQVSTATVTIDIGNIVAGGNGLGQKLPGNENVQGVNPATGDLSSELLEHLYTNGYHLTGSTPFIDGTFILKSQSTATQINGAGVTFTPVSGDGQGVSYDIITSSREPGQNLPLTIGGTTFPTGVGICSSAGVTFDLSALNAFYQTKLSNFSALFGKMNGPGSVRGYVVFSDNSGIVGEYTTAVIASSTDAPEHIDIPIPASARYMTLMTGAVGAITNDHAAFVAVTVSDDNESVPIAQEARVDLPYAFTAYRGNQISISDADAGENAVRVTLSVDKGTITLLNPDPNGGLTYSAGDGTEDASMTFVGTVADINTALQWVSYRPQASYTGLATFTITTNDLGNVGTGGAKTDTDTIAITVNPVPAFAASPTYETLPGVLDTSLNGTGKQVLSLTAGIDYIHDMKVMPDGKILAVGALNDRFGLMRFNADMTLDTSFGTTGMTQTDFGAGVHARSLAIESSGRIVVVGGNRIARYTETGVLDTAFGTNGSVTNANVGQAYGVAIQADGRVVVAGRDNNYFKVARYSAAGVLDADWSYNVGNGYSGDYGRAVVVRDDGDIFVAGKGYFWNGTDYDNFTVDRIDANGTLEQEFSYNLGSDEFVNSMLALPDGKLLLIGRCNGDLTITRHAASGALDTSFGTSGIVRVPILNAADEGYRATLAADGKILVTGFANNGTNQDLFVVRLTSNGVLDNNFGIGGKVAVNLGSNDYGYAIAALPDGKILVAGRSANDIALVRLLGDFDLNSAPEDISLSASSIPENQPAGSVIGTLTTSDPDEEPSYTYSLVTGTGDADNASFAIVGDQLRTAASFDYELKASYSVRIRTTDAGGKYFEKQFTISVTNVNDGEGPVVLNTPTGQTATDAQSRSGTMQLVKQGAGTLILDAANTHSGGTVVEEGTVIVRNTATLGSGRLTVKAGATLKLDVGSRTVPLSAITMEPGSLLDVGFGKFTVATGGITAPDIRTLIVNGYGSGDWTTTAGITTRSAGTLSGGGVGYVVHGDGSITVGFAAQGDTDLDGSVDLIDIVNFLTSAKFDVGAAASWQEGDFNYDSIVDLLDVQRLLVTDLVDKGPYIPTSAPEAAASSSQTTSALDAAFVAFATTQATNETTAVKKLRFGAV